jgi:malonyl-CoA/methylmalonyl-CoA synthetase
VGEGGRESRDDEPGEIHISGPTVFKEYWNKPEATHEVFTEDGWFKTGDIAVRERGSYRILGRESTDILKTGGYKVSALEIEAVLREHDDITECTVVGVPDDEWGQRVAAALVLAPGARLDLEQLRSWGKQRLAAYKVPTLMLCLDELPRNPMGKVTKPAVAALFADRRS